MRRRRTAAHRKRPALPALGALLALLSADCARNPATGERQLMLVSEAQEIELGRQAAEQVRAEFGFVEERDVAALVSRVGTEMAKSSERPELPWEFHLLDSPVVNAFALPGGFIYLTRGILAHMNSEAAMAGVLGHEIGHVTARHSAQQLSRAQLANLGLGLGMIFVPEVRPFGDLLQVGAGLMFLKFGRDAERQADSLGVRYSLDAGYDAHRMARFFNVFDRLQEGEGQLLPTWLSTHPAPENREARILELVQERVGPNADLTVNEDGFKRRLEGMVYGENPREGFMDGNTFKHPDLRFQMTFPEGWRVQNTRQAVYAATSEAAFQLTARRRQPGVSPAEHAAQFFRQNQLQSAGGSRETINSFSAFVAPFQAQSSAGLLAGESAFLEDGDLIYELLAYTRAQDYRRLRGTFFEIFESFSRLTDRRALQVQPRRIRIVRVPRSMTLKEALRQSGADPDELEELAIVNNLFLDDRVEPGALIKTVEGSRVGRETAQDRAASARIGS